MEQEWVSQRVAIRDSSRHCFTWTVSPGGGGEGGVRGGRGKLEEGGGWTNDE